HRSAGPGNDGAQPLSDAAVRGDGVPRRGAGERGPALAVPLPRPAPADAAKDAGAAAPALQGHARLPRRAGLPGGRDAAAGPEHAGGGARLPGAEPGDAGELVRLAAVAAAL